MSRDGGYGAVSDSGYGAVSDSGYEAVSDSGFSAVSDSGFAASQLRQNKNSKSGKSNSIREKESCPNLLDWLLSLIGI